MSSAIDSEEVPLSTLLVVPDTVMDEKAQVAGIRDVNDLQRLQVQAPGFSAWHYWRSSEGRMPLTGQQPRTGKACRHCAANDSQLLATMRDAFCWGLLQVSSRRIMQAR